MNFVGHVALAARFSDEPAFFLGAMLPDFSSMLGVRAPDRVPGALGEGIRFHHLTDEVFHALPWFTELQGEALRFLRARGVAAGTRRAVAHVGVELLLDAELAEDPRTRAAYLGGLSAGRDPTVLGSLPWPAVQRARLQRLAAILEERSDSAKAGAAVVVERLARALSSHPRLAVGPDALKPVTDWVELGRARVVASAPVLVANLAQAIAGRFT